MVATEKSGENLTKASHTKVQFSLRWKIAIIFSILFFAAFLLTLTVVTAQVTKEADTQVQVDLIETLEGAAKGVDVEMLLELAETGIPNSLGYSNDPRYISLLNWLDTIHSAEPDAWPYLYIPAEDEEHIYFVVDLYAIYDDRSASTFMEYYKSNSGCILLGLEEQTFRAVDPPLVATLNQWGESVEGWDEDSESWLAAGLWRIADWLEDSNIAPHRDFGTYEDQFGRWASGYMPLMNAEGEKVAGIGVDFKADMINKIRANVRTTISRTYLVCYLILVSITFLISYKMTKPIANLTKTASEIGKNNHYVGSFETRTKYRAKDEIDVLGAVLKDTYEKLEQANLQLQQLSHQLISDREQYRKELARNLHDNVLSYLSVISTNQQKELDQEAMRENYRHIIERLRATIFSLRPPMLEYGLVMAIEDYLDSFRERTEQNGYQILVDLPNSDIRFGESVETHIFRIVQQAFDNALEHANASEITIRGKIETDMINISVEDNGTGILKKDNGNINLEDYKCNKKYGVVGMIERAALIGASLNVKPNQNSGTIVEVSWQPQKEKSAAN